MSLAEALDVIESGNIFSCLVVSYDASRKTGGNKKYYEQLVHPKDPNLSAKPSESKAQNHYVNATRNCLVCVDGEPTSVIRKIHIFLLLEVNGEKVML